MKRIQSERERFINTFMRDFPEGYQETDRVALEMGRRSADRLTQENLSNFRSFVQRLMDKNPSPYVRAWMEAIRQGPEQVRELFTDTSDRGQVMRSVISFRAFVPKAERDMLVRDAGTVRNKLR